MKILLLTEALPGKGLGHVMRCSSLYAAFKERGDAARLLVAADPERVLPEFCERTDWRSAIWQDPDLGDACVIVDSYSAGLPVYQRLGTLAGCLAFLDDDNRLAYPAGILINSAAGAEELYRPLRSELQYLTGLTYAALRPQFWQAGPIAVRDRIENVLITMGADDALNMTGKVLSALESLDARKTVIAGPGFNRDFSGDSVQVVRAPDAAGMRDAMLAADLAVTAGGQTVFELCKCGVPFVPVLTADNQEAILRGLLGAGLIDEFLGAGSEDFSVRLKAAAGRLEGAAAREERSARLSAAVDGRGPFRTAEAIERLCK